MAIDKLTSPVTPNDSINKINEIIDNWPSGGGSGTSDPTTWYGTCNTTASTTEKAVTCSDFSLVKGAIISILFTTANTAATPTLNINNTGAKTIYIGATVPNSTTNALKWSANTLLTFMYDGTYFRYLGAEAAGSVVPPRGAGSWYGTSASTATSSAKTSAITNFVLTKGAMVTITFTNANTYADGAITLNVNSTGAKTIYYKNAATSDTNTLPWDTGDALTFIYTGSYYYFVSKAANVGTHIGMTNTAAIPIPSGDPATPIANVTLSTGTWILVGKIRFSTNGNGIRRGNIETTSGTTAINVQVQAVNNNQNTTDIQVTKVVDVSGSATYYLNAWQNSGSELNCPANIGWLTAVRIA